MSQDFVKDLLLQIQEQQTADSKVLHELKGNMEPRIKSLENAQTRNWWMTYVVTPVLFLASSTARHFGVRL